MFKYVSLLKWLSHYVVNDFKSHIISKNTSSLIDDTVRVGGIILNFSAVSVESNLGCTTWNYF